MDIPGYSHCIHIKHPTKNPIIFDAHLRTSERIGTCENNWALEGHQCPSGCLRNTCHVAMDIITIELTQK